MVTEAQHTIITDPAARELHRLCPDLTTEQLHSPETQTLARTLVSMIDQGWIGGVGLAAPQIGSTSRLVVFRYSAHGNPVIAANLHVTRAWGDILLKEGCLSIPHREFTVRRAERVSATWTDLQGKQVSIRRAYGLFAQVLQHECDHLDGFLVTDRLEVKP